LYPERRAGVKSPADAVMNATPSMAASASGEIRLGLVR
jgi:hypothetical protein